jgi:hypothetical protein
MTKEKIDYRKLIILNKVALAYPEFAEYIIALKKLSIADYCKKLASAMEYHHERDTAIGI